MDSQSFSKLVQDFFLKRLMNQQHISLQTMYSYRDSFRLLLNFINKQTNKDPSNLTLNDLNAEMILKFLNHLEKERNNCIKTRNLRLTAIRSFLQYVSYEEPASSGLIQRALAIPQKRSDRPQVIFLSKEEIDAVINTPNLSTWSGKRDHVMFMTLYNTGARVSEITGLKIIDVAMGTNAYVNLHGKGRKERTLPIWIRTRRLIKNWLNYLNGNANGLLFPNRQGNRLTRHGVEYRVCKTKDLAANKCPSLKNKQVSTHTFRRTCAIHLLQAGVDICGVSLWLGHEDINTTYRYLEANLAMKEKSLQRLDSPSSKMKRFRASDSLLNFLDKLSGLC